MVYFSQSYKIEVFFVTGLLRNLELSIVIKKRKDTLETWAVLLIFLLELEISGVAVQGIHQNSEKWRRLLGTAQ